MICNTHTVILNDISTKKDMPGSFIFGLAINKPFLCEEIVLSLFPIKHMAYRVCGCCLRNPVENALLMHCPHKIKLQVANGETEAILLSP